MSNQGQVDKGHPTDQSPNTPNHNTTLPRLSRAPSRESKASKANKQSRTNYFSSDNRTEDKQIYIMGAFQSIFSRLWSKKEVRILILGLVCVPSPRSRCHPFTTLRALRGSRACLLRGSSDGEASVRQSPTRSDEVRQHPRYARFPLASPRRIPAHYPTRRTEASMPPMNFS